MQPWCLRLENALVWLEVSGAQWRWTGALVERVDMGDIPIPGVWEGE